MRAYVQIKDTDRLFNDRVQLGYSIRKLAQLADISPSIISKLENNTKTTVSPDTARRICDSINCKFTDLFEVIKCEISA